jgi:hypothetical protein
VQIGQYFLASFLLFERVILPKVEHFIAFIAAMGMSDVY